MYDTILIKSHVETKNYLANQPNDQSESSLEIELYHHSSRCEIQMQWPDFGSKLLLHNIREEKKIV